MDSVPVITQVCLEYLPRTGGTTTSIDNFRRVLGSDVMSFTSLARSNGLRNGEKTTHIPVWSAWPASAYAVPRMKQLRTVDHLLRESNLIISHMLYRYHIQWASSIARRMRIPYWVVPHGSLDPYVFTYRAWQKKVWMSIFGRRILREASRVIFATEREKHKAAAWLDCNNACVMHWPINAVDTSNREQVRNCIRAEFNIAMNDRVLLYLGRIHPSKRLLETLEAFGHCRQNNLHLLIVGPDSEALSRYECADFCMRTGIANVHFVGPVYGDERYKYFMAADGFISLSNKENFGYSVGEALVCGLPVILSPGIDLAPELLDLECGWVLASAEVVEATSAIEQFAKKASAEILDMGERGYRWARKELSFDSFSARVLTLVEDTLAEFTWSRRGG
jgi:glycosyltransferase involved in cell wall biosynthesis